MNATQEDKDKKKRRPRWQIELEAHNGLPTKATSTSRSRRNSRVSVLAAQTEATTKIMSGSNQTTKISTPVRIFTKQQQEEKQEEEEQKKKKKKEQTPKKQYQSLHYDEALLLFRFISNNESVSFKSYCDAHADVLGGKGTDTRQKMKNHYQYWRKEGKLPSKYNDPSYPEELVRCVSFKLSLIAKQKEENKNNNNNNTSSTKEDEKPQNGTAVSFSPSPISLPSLRQLQQSMKYKSQEFTKVFNLPISLDDVRVHIRFPLNINHPYRNIQGAFPFRIPSCPKTRIINDEEKTIGYYDKLCFHLPCWDIIDSIKNDLYKAWLHPNGNGLFVKMPPTGRCFTKYPGKLHDCEVTDYRVDNFLSENGVFPIIVFYKFPNNMICSNEVFNDTTRMQGPNDLVLLPKVKTTKNWVIKPNTNETYPDGEYETSGGIVWEMEIVSEDNFQIQEKQNDRKVLEEMFANMTMA